MEGIQFSRPMTHDLLKNFLDLVKAKIERIEICDLKNNTYFALIRISHKNTAMAVDARPSDALALSLRVGVPIFVSDEVIKKSELTAQGGEPEDKSEKGKQWTEMLKSLDPEDFGNT
jgi:bifunctional DNase/RNase